MNLIGQFVLHKSFGEGKVTKCDENYITIKFSNSEKTFSYPTSFKNFLIAKDNRINDEIHKKIIALEEQNKADEESKHAAEIQRQYELERIKTQVSSTNRMKKVYSRANIAFKCNFCDGGQSKYQVGFNGVCSDSIIHNNILIEKRTWCCSDECPCGQYLNGIINRKELESYCDGDGLVCYESQMLRDWKALAGIVQRGEKKGQPMKLNQVQTNSLCVLTTRDPGSNEKERYIFAVFLVDESYEGDTREEGYVTTSSKYKIKLSPKEAHSMLFWNYHSNDNQPEVPAWNSGLHRYFDDVQAMQILKDISVIKKGTPDENLAKEFLNYYITINKIDLESIPEMKGALIRNGI